MSVTTTATEVIYTENGSNLVYDFSTFTIFEQTDLVVTSLIAATNLPNPNYTNGILTLGIDYTVTINADGTGSIAKTVALSNAYELVISRQLPITQQVVLVDNEGTDASTYEEAYDRLTMIAQQLQAQINRSLLQPITVETPISFPAPVASTYLGFDINANLTTLTSVSTVILTPISPTVALNIAQVNAAGTNLQYVTLLSLLTGLASWLSSLTSANGTLPAVCLPVGTASGNIVQLGASGLPAVSGALLTNLPSQRGPILSITDTAGQSLTANSWTQRTFNTVLEDSGGYWSSNAYTPLVAGWYLITYTDLISNSANGSISICGIYKNGSLISQALAQVPTGSSTLSPSTTILLFLNGSTDNVKFYVNCNANGTVGGASADTWASIVRVF